MQNVFRHIKAHSHYNTCTCTFTCSHKCMFRHNPCVSIHTYTLIHRHIHLHVHLHTLKIFNQSLQTHIHLNSSKLVNAVNLTFIHAHSHKCDHIGPYTFTYSRTHIHISVIKIEGWTLHSVATLIITRCQSAQSNRQKTQRISGKHTEGMWERDIVS